MVAAAVPQFPLMNARGKMWNVAKYVLNKKNYKRKKLKSLFVTNYNEMW